MRYFLLLALCLLGLSLSTQAVARTSNGIAAIVNDDIITHSQLADRLQMIIASSKLPKTQAFRQQIAGQVLTSLITETVQLQEAERLGFAVTEEAIDKGFGQIAQQNKLSPEKFESVLRRQGVPIHALRAQIATQIAWSNVVQTQLRPKVIISDNDVTAEMERRTGMIGKQEYQLAEIFIPVIDDDKEAEARQTANNLVRQLRNKQASFPVLARRFSQAASAAGGGDIGWITQGTLAPELDEALPSMRSGSISEPIRVEEGYVILNLRNTRGVEAGKSADEDSIRQELGMKKLDILQRRYLRDIRSAAYVETRIE